MKKTTLLAAMAVCLPVIDVFAQRIESGDVCLPLTQTEAENFMNKNKAVRITVTGGGSSVGIFTLMEGITDIAMASRKIKSDERMELQEAGKKTKEEIIAYDALAVVMHPSNEVSNPTQGQLGGIFTGKARNWKEVGGTDTKIVAYSRETSSRTCEFFRGSMLKSKNYMNGILSMSVTGATIQSVNQTEGVIGYVGFAYLNKEVRPIHVSCDAGKSYVEPSLESVRGKTYPAVRPLFYYYETKNTLRVRLFIDYVMSVERQAMVEKVGYISVKQVENPDSVV